MLKLNNASWVSLLVTVLFFVFILPLNESIAFTPPESQKSLIIANALKLLFAVSLYFIVYFIFNFIQRFKAKDSNYTSWFKYSLLYFAVLFIVFLLIYPGHWVADEFRILDTVKNYNLTYTWQNYFTNIFYTFSLYLIPTASSIVFFQIVIISLIVGYIISRLQKLFSLGKSAYWLFLPLLLPPVILNNLYPLRAALYSFVLLLLLCKLVLLYHNHKQLRNKSRELTFLAFLITLVSFWRTEGIYFLILLPILVFWLGIINKKNYKTFKSYIPILPSVFIVVFGFLVVTATGSKLYPLTAAANPLSTMLQQPLRGNNIDNRLKEIDKVLDVELLKRYPSYVEVPAFWKGAPRTNYEPYVGQFWKQYIYIIANNPLLFLENRAKVFMHTNSLHDKPSASLGYLDMEDYLQRPLSAHFISSNYFSEPYSVGLKKYVTNLLLGQSGYGKTTVLGKILWNIILPIILLTGVGIFCLIRHHFFWAGVTSLLLTQALLIFLTAPANYFFYYMPIYLIGYFLAVLHLLVYLHKRQHSTSKQRGR